MKQYVYHCMPMHLHTCHQPGSSMEAHIYNAHQLGMRYIRFTDHDTRVGALKARLHHFDFTCPEGQSATWGGFGDAVVTCGDGALTVTAANGAHGGATLTKPGKAQSVSLLAEVTVTLQMEITLTGDAGAAFTVQLSQRPGDHLPAHMWYVIGSAPDDLPPHTVCLPLTPTSDGVYRLAVSADARQHAEGGMDNAYNFPGVAVWAGTNGTATLRMTGYTMQTAYAGEDVLRRQRILGDEIGRRYGIKPYITTEISGAGHHKNYYGEQVPCIDYTAGPVTQEEAIAHVLAHQGIFCYNHPFESSFYKKNKFPPEEQPAQTEREAAELIAARVYGATLMEVGFPRGRGGFPQSEHFRLWDLISLSGIFITGCGDSDSHESHLSWMDGNNFASWIAAPASLPHPVPDAVFIESMKAGRVYGGDPTQLRTALDFTSEGRPMGAILALDEEDTRAREMTFTAECLPEGWTVRLIDSGRCAEEHTITWGGTYTFRFMVAPTRPVSFGRVELYNADGRCVGFTNPIYLVRRHAFHGELPAERLYEEVTL